MERSAGERRREFEEEALVHLDALYGLGLRLIRGDEGRTEDQVQGACVRARSRDDYEPGTDCPAWLTTLLRNTFLDPYPRRERRPAGVGYDHDATGRSVSRHVRDEERDGEFFGRIVDDEVVEAIEDLEGAFRVPLVLADLEGFGHREIADALDVPVGTVDSRLRRARTRVQGKLYEYAREMGYVR